MMMSQAHLPSCSSAQAAQSKSTAASGDWSTPGLAQSDDMQQKFYKIGNGVKVQQLTDGKGTASKAGDKVLFDYVLRRSNGYFIYAYAFGKLHFVFSSGMRT